MGTSRACGAEDDIAGSRSGNPFPELAGQAVVVECINSLDFLGDETTVQYLIPMLTHSDEDVRSAAADAIKSLQ